MKKLGLAIAILALVGCSATNQKTTTSTTPATQQSENIAKNSLSWGGVYEGVLPCADCEGITTTLTLNYDGTFMLDRAYKQGKTTFMPQPVVGTFEWNQTKPLIYLKAKNEQNIFFVGEGYVKAYDQEGNPIDSQLNFTLKQIKVFE